MRKPFRRAIAHLAVIAILFVVFASIFDSLVEGVIFQPAPGADLSPERLGIDAESVYLHSDDGVKIHAFYLPGGTPGRAASRAVLFLHGNAGNVSHRLPNAAALMRLGCAVLVLDYRGYGLSDGRPSETGSYRDARAGLAYLTERGFSNREIVVFGRSLGGAIAIELAQDRELAGVILESTFSSAADVARGIGGPILAFLVGGRFDSISRVERVLAPLLFFHGDRDEVIDYRLGRRLYDAAPKPKEFETIQGAGHNDTTMIGGQAYYERIRDFIDAVAPPRTGPGSDSG
jgi:fermentation-respiration switch protein FrsA (DUF1100 family)